MCGIVGYAGDRPCRDILFKGLRKLEYRGYDSAGISVISEGQFDLLHSVGNLDRLEEILNQMPNQSHLGIAHTRWATHGRPSNENAHPHLDCTGRFAIVLNGIVENYLTLREELQAEGHEFTSETDAEVVAHLIERAFRGDLRDAAAEAFRQMEGHFTYVAITTEDPETMVAVRKETPLVIGLGENENFLASAVTAFLSETRTVIFPDDAEFVTVTRDSVVITDFDGKVIERQAEEVDWDEDAAEKGGYQTFMLKEINEQPTALADTLAERVTHEGRVELEGLGLDDGEIQRLRQVIIVACGTSHHAGLVGKYALEKWARLPVEIDVASEFRYREPVIGPDTLTIAITQSGETADTLAAMRLARQAGSKVLAITNIVGSQATREADGVLFTRAGLEIGVAATKTFEAQVLAVILLALYLAEVRGHLGDEYVKQLTEEIRRVPTMLNGYLEDGRLGEIEAVAKRYAKQRFFLYLGRNIGLPVCMEGALKLKEISYIPSEAYAAGEMKHGPIALLDEGSPVVVVATDGHTYEKLISNIQEVKARGAHVIAVASEGNKAIADMADEVFYVPKTDEVLSPLLATVPLQLFAYYVATANGESVDQPRNLAKTVTVE